EGWRQPYRHAAVLGIELRPARVEPCSGRVMELNFGTTAADAKDKGEKGIQKLHSGNMITQAITLRRLSLRPYCCLFAAFQEISPFFPALGAKCLLAR